MRIVTRSVEETLGVGRLIGRLAPAGQSVCVALDGELGAGKTQLTRGIAEGAGVADVGLVSSPTYVLLNVYPAGESGKTVYHLDAYRIAGEEEFAGGGVGFEELLNDQEGGLVVVEWARRVEHLLPADRIQVALQHGQEEGTRELTVEGLGERSRLLVDQLRELLQLRGSGGG